MSPDTSRLTYCKLMDVMDRCEELQKEFSPDLFVTKDTPPTFWYHTGDDETVPVEQGLRFIWRCSRPACRWRRISLPMARTAAGWAKATRRWTSGRNCSKHGCGRRG